MHSLRHCYPCRPPHDRACVLILGEFIVTKHPASPSPAHLLPGDDMAPTHPHPPIGGSGPSTPPSHLITASAAKLATVHSRTPCLPPLMSPPPRPRSISPPQRASSSGAGLCLLLGVKVKAAQSCLTLPTSCTAARQAPPSVGFSRQGTGVGSHGLLHGVFLTRQLNPGLLHCGQIPYQLSQQGSPSGCFHDIPEILSLPCPGPPGD